MNFRYRSDKESALVRLLEDAIRESGRHGVPLDDAELARDREEDELVEPIPLPEPPLTNTAVPEHSHVGESPAMRLWHEPYTSPRTKPEPFWLHSATVLATAFHLHILSCIG